MKKLLIISSLMTVFLCASGINMEDIDRTVNQIKPDRDGLNLSLLSTLKNPFVMLTKTVTKDGEVIQVKTHAKHTYSTTRTAHLRFKLLATMNKSAKINGRWVMLNQKISGYTLVDITKGSVKLKRKNDQPITVLLARQRSSIKILTK